MNLESVGKCVSEISSQVGKRKIPRYLYHFTTEKKYASILRDGSIKPSAEEVIKGVFTVDLNNFIKRWKSVLGVDMREMLIKLQIAKEGNEKLIALRIPTKNLAPQKMKIRSYNRWYSAVAKNPEGYCNAVTNRMQGADNNIPEEFIHFFEGDKATNAGLYKQRKEAIEYIYDGDIDASLIEKIGESTIHEDGTVKKFLSHIFSQSPEKKAVDMLA